MMAHSGQRREIGVPTGLKGRWLTASHARKRVEGMCSCICTGDWIKSLALIQLDAIHTNCAAKTTQLSMNEEANNIINSRCTMDL